MTVYHQADTDAYGPAIATFTDRRTNEVQQCSVSTNDIRIFQESEYARKRWIITYAPTWGEGAE